MTGLAIGLVIGIAIGYWLGINSRQEERQPTLDLPPELPVVTKRRRRNMHE